MGKNPVLPQIVHTWMFGEMERNRLIDHLRFAGMDGVDLSIQSRGINSAENLIQSDFKKMLSDNGLSAMVATPLYMEADLDLSSADTKIRRNAIDFSLRAADAAAFYKAPLMLIAPSWVSVTHSLCKPYGEHWRYSVESIAEVADYTAKLGISVLIEPINRYRVSLVHTVEEALKMCADINRNNVYLVPDVYHMHMEEANGVCAAIVSAGKSMQCLHIGDNTRRSPGYGIMSWREIIAALYSTGFSGPLSYEPVQLYFDERRVAGESAYAEQFVNQLKNGTGYLRNIMDLLNG